MAHPGWPEPAVLQDRRPLASPFAGLFVNAETAAARVAICATCEHSALSPNQTRLCKVCSVCKGPGQSVDRLARYVEHLPFYGCKHPQRKGGKGWTK